MERLTGSRPSVIINEIDSHKNTFLFCASICNSNNRVVALNTGDIILLRSYIHSTVEGTNRTLRISHPVAAETSPEIEGSQLSFFQNLKSKVSLWYATTCIGLKTARYAVGQDSNRCYYFSNQDLIGLLKLDDKGVAEEINSRIGQTRTWEEACAADKPAGQSWKLPAALLITLGLGALVYVKGSSIRAWLSSALPR
jgi:hypothetical protein